MTPYFWLLFVAVLAVLACEWGALQTMERWFCRWRGQFYRVRGRRAAQREMAAQARLSDE